MLNVVQKKEFLLKAYKVAQGSPDPSTQNGAIIVKQDGDQYVPITGACNTFVKGVVSKAERLKTPLKYSIFCHIATCTYELMLAYPPTPLGV